MAKILVTSTINSISADLGEYHSGSTPYGFIPTADGVWRKNDVSFKKQADHVRVDIKDEKLWKVSNVEDLSNQILKIDSIDASPPSDLDDLYIKLKTLLA